MGDCLNPKNKSHEKLTDMKHFMNFITSQTFNSIKVW
jgi:hypothetical protein